MYSAERGRVLNWINYQDSRPIYEQITERYKLLILKGVLAPGEQMPSVRKLAMELSTNPNTVQRAYAELERQGFLYSVRGRGSFVRGDSGRTAVRHFKRSKGNRDRPRTASSGMRMEGEYKK